MSFRSLPREVMCQKAPSNSSLSGLDMPRGSLGVKKTRRNSTESTEDVSIPRRYRAVSIQRVESRRLTRGRGLTLLLLALCPFQLDTRSYYRFVSGTPRASGAGRSSDRPSLDPNG